METHANILGNQSMQSASQRQKVLGFERFFRLVASVEVEGTDFPPYERFINRKVCELLTRGQAAARANGHEVVQPAHLVIPAGLQRNMDTYRSLAFALDMDAPDGMMTIRTPCGVLCSHEIDVELPAVAGGLSVAVARSFKMIDPRIKCVYSPHWQTIFALFDLLV